MIIPENKIEEIRTAANIVDIISDYVQLKKRGKNFIGNCPFHSEKTPSFTVSPEKQIYHCFGCHAGGNVFKFLMDYESISFVEAVQDVAKKTGITLDIEENFRPEQQSEQEILYDINTVAAKYFSENLLNSLQGEYAREYFKSRKIKTQTQRIFGLGYALQNWDGFLNHAKANNVDLDKAKSLGLIDAKDGGGYYDKFRSRIMFPIFSPNGRVIAFGGRILDKAENTAKYLNSPESAIYSKRKSLYGLFHSKDEIRKHDKAILVEGYIDLISLYQNGVKNVVASLGTALTEEQAQLLSRYTKNIVVFYDADPAGIKASIRSIEILVKQNFDVKIAEMPEGEDPDTFINKFGKDDFNELVNKSLNFLEYQTAQLEKQGMFNDPSKQTEAVRQLIQSASFVSDELKRTIFLKNIAKKFNLRERLLETEIEKILGSEKEKEKRQEAVAVKIREAEKKEKSGEQKVKIHKSEIEIVKLLFQGNKSVIKYIFEHITPEQLYLPNFRLAAEVVYEQFFNGENISPASLIEKIENKELQDFLWKLTIEKYGISKRWDAINPGDPSEKIILKETRDVIRSFKISKIEEEISEALEQITQAKDENELLSLMKLKHELVQERSAILKEETED